MTAIRLESLVKRFGTTTAVAGVDLEIAAGELFFLLGPSGCGKTTLLRMIAGFIEPSGGCIVFVERAGDGPPRERDVSSLPPNKRNTGMVFQSYALWPHMTVAQNVAYGLKVRKVAAAERTRRVKEALERVQMGEYGERRPNQLSGGQQQRVALARALVVEPSVLLLDEPLSNLDAKLRLEMRSEIRRICKHAGITGIYVTHDQKEALSMADRIAVMDRGRVAQIGTPRGLYDRPATRFVADFLGESNFLDGTIETVEGGRAVIETAAGRLVSTALPAGSAAGASVTVSIRPEAFALVPAPESLATAPEGRARLEGFLVERIYLGEQAQHLVRLPGDAVVKVMESNPRPFDVAHPGERHAVDGHVEVEEAPSLVLEVDQAHVVVLPPASGGG